MTDREVRDIFKTLSQTASSLAKLEILTNSKDDETLSCFIDYLLNPFNITGISEKKIKKNVEKEPTKDFKTFRVLMDYILTNNTGSDEVIANIQAFLAGQDDDMKEFYSSVITKSAKLGCDVKTVNKAYGKEFIPQWEVQQSYSIDKYTLNENEWFSLSEKLNGVRGTFCNGKIMSRQGKEITGLDHIIADIGRLFTQPDTGLPYNNPNDVVLDGELVRNNTDGLTDNENFRIGTGILSRDDADKSCMKLVIFDIIPLNEFISGKSTLTYKERLSTLKLLTDCIKALNITSLGTVDVLYTGTDINQIEFYLEKMVREDKEGLMLNRDSNYQRKRHNGILKVKRFYTVDLEIKALEEGSGRLAGMLGAFVADYKGNRLNVGSGMTDSQRSAFWADKDALIGRVIEVKYKEESQDKKTGQYSLQFPIFIGLREEGKQISYD